jgi:casein kinase 1, epsilon
MLFVSHNCAVTNIGYPFDYVFDWTILMYPQIGANPWTRVCEGLLYLFDVRFYSLLDLLHLLTIVYAGEITSGAAGPSMDKMEKALGLPCSCKKMLNKSMVQSGHMFKPDLRAGEASSRRNPSGPVNQSDRYAQWLHETVSLPCKLNFPSLHLLYGLGTFNAVM